MQRDMRATTAQVVARYIGIQLILQKVEREALRLQVLKTPSRNKTIPLRHGRRLKESNLTDKLMTRKQLEQFSRNLLVDWVLSSLASATAHF